ncbi:polyprenyl synthetase family protein [Kitasatospora sp. NPDC088134]|uniref:polyprenyl synthetase family protein n=1 Tax=Kitasatospora sp. NPDC088134 TaxID=3364071 RepID=UPI0038280E79
MLTDLRRQLAPLLTAGYGEAVERWTSRHLADLPDLATAYRAYTLADRNLNRPLLTLVGYGARRGGLGAELYDEVGPACFVAQVVRDFLAIHDDVVDGDREKFGQPTLPAVLGNEAAIFFGDLLLGLVGDLIAGASIPAEARHRLQTRVLRALRRVQHGQLTELALQRRPLREIRTETLLKVYADKAAEYCYVLPFEIGIVLAGESSALADAVRPVLLDIGVASQIIDDIAGQTTGSGKDTPGELLHLRRTVLLSELSSRIPSGHPLEAALSGQTATADDIPAIREAFVSSGALHATGRRAEALADRTRAAIPTLPLGGPATEYLMDLLAARVTDNLASWTTEE